ncbi:MAG: glycoside hydrolase family 5 protein [Fibrobacterales bacterium]
MQRLRSVFLVIALGQLLFVLWGCSEDVPLLQVEGVATTSSSVALSLSSSQLSSNRFDSTKANDSLGTIASSNTSSNDSMDTMSSHDLLSSSEVLYSSSELLVSLSSVDAGDDQSVSDKDTSNVSVFDPDAPFVEISNWDMAKRMGRGINMGNTLEARNGEGSMAPAAQEYYFDDYKEAGFTNVRIPIHWGTRIDAAGNVNSDFMNRIEEVVDWSLARGLVTIINTHHEEWVINDYSGNKGKLLKIWEQIGERFKDKNENLVFEVFNEPRDPMGPSDVTDLNFAVVAEIRKTNPKRICIVTGDNWGYFNDLKTVTWPDDPYIIASLHYYDPSSFTHDDDRTWDDTGRMWQNLDGVLEWLHEERGVPGFVGEFGVNHRQHDKEWESVYRFYNTTTDAFSKWETPYSVWDDHGWYKVYDRHERTYNDILGALQWEH